MMYYNLSKHLLRIAIGIQQTVKRHPHGLVGGHVGNIPVLIVEAHHEQNRQPHRFRRGIGKLRPAVILRRGLNLRAEPNGDILGSYPRGTKVTVLSTNGAWSKVSVDGKTGYMMAKYLKVTSEIVSGTARVFNANGGSHVNFRSRASLSASIIGTVPVGTTVKVLEKTTDWTKVEVNGKTGYISTWFLKF